MVRVGKLERVATGVTGEVPFEWQNRVQVEASSK